MSEIKNIRDQFISKLEKNLSIDQINEIKTELFGKNGLISSKFKTIVQKAQQKKGLKYLLKEKLFLLKQGKGMA